MIISALAAILACRPVLLVVTAARPPDFNYGTITTSITSTTSTFLFYGSNSICARSSAYGSDSICARSSGYDSARLKDGAQGGG